ncbi:hypothetical protein IW261DRAFT_1608051 [Armillaria novae-zelandiae]|uniref:Uncharacterized protein n=1 Tax=Armillaria novae-zelandiae TaxID=153914 RepID=A0AA39P983_9AGAR|nr:hypothetical protein IW261DRAFT_1608051 [Armillaria novae-zelandiae]
MILPLGIRGPILNIKQERLLENYHFQDVARRDTLWKEQEAILAIDNAEDVDDPQPDERQASAVTLPLPSEHDTESQYDGSVHKTIGTSRAPSIVSKRPTKLSDFLRSINDPWNFFHELDALKRIEADYHERMKAKVPADIDRAREKDEALYTHLQSKMPKRKHERLPVEMIAISVMEDANSGTNI